MIRLAMTVAAPFLLAACAGGPGGLGPTAVATGFVPIGDVHLASSTGDADGVPAIFRRTELRLEDAEVTRSIGMVQFDNWFAAEGVDLIVENTRQIPLPVQDFPLRR